jgi:hypothetical protein
MWSMAVVALILAAAVGIASYDAGLSQGLARAGAVAAQAAPAPPFGYYYYGGWHHHGPFPFFFLGPLFGVLFVMFVLRMLFGGLHRGAGLPRWHGRGYDWDEWHRRAHERMKNPSADDAHPGR